ERLDVLERRRLERLEAVALVHAAHHTDDVLPPPDVAWQEVARAARWFSRQRHSCSRGGSRRSDPRTPGCRRPPRRPGCALPCRDCPSRATAAAPSCPP